jgi:5-methylcytosine-specific restriction endonuclease McrA
VNLTVKERNLIKGAIRRVFSRSELRKTIIQEARITHYDPNRPRVTKWGKCAHCQQLIALYQMEVDHIEPIIPVDKSLESMSWDEIISRIFCAKENLTALCKPCHSVKTKAENKLRAKARKERKNEQRN